MTGPSGGEPVIRAHVRISGRVQGVGFRYATAHQARDAGVNGWVRNLGEETVEAVFEGRTEAVERVVAWCRQGPPSAWVRDVLVDWQQPPQHLERFEIRLSM